MRINFTDSEIDRWLEVLEKHFLTDSVEAIEAYEMIRKKFKNAQSRSNASKKKIKFIREAKRKKTNEERSKIQADILRDFSRG